VIVRGLRTHADFDGIRRAFADKRSARKILVTRLDAVVYRWMNGNHESTLPML
jgi:hypothetical protein